MLAQYVETEKNETNQNIAVRKEIEVVNTVRLECPIYDNVSARTPKSIKDKIWYCLSTGKELTNSQERETLFDIEEKARFQRMKEIIETMRLNNDKRLAAINNPVETHKVIIRSRIPILAAYAVLVLVVLAALIAVVPGTSWEAKSRVNLQQNVSVAPVQAAAPNVNINTIVTEEGPVQVELTPYAEDEVIETNWFDRLCDKVSKVFGG